MANDKLKLHDAFLKSLLSDPGRARTFLQRLLPAHLCRELNLDSLEVDDRSFIRRDLHEFFADALFRVSLRNAPEKQAIVSILLEHKSYPDQRVAVQMLTYLAEGYRTQSAEKAMPHQKKYGAKMPPPPLYPIIPFLFYHGKEDWEFKPLRQLFDPIYANLLHYIPTFETIYTNLRKVSEQDILRLQEAWLRTVLLTQKYSHDPNALINRFALIFQTLFEIDERNFFQKFIVYYIKTTALNQETFRVLWKQLPQNQNSAAMTWIEEAFQGYQRGIEQGIEQGLEKGKAQGLDLGITLQKLEIIRKGIQNHISLSILSTLTGYSESEIQRIVEEEALNKN